MRKGGYAENAEILKSGNAEGRKGGRAETAENAEILKSGNAERRKDGRADMLKTRKF